MAYKRNKIQYVLLIQLIKLVSLHYLWKNKIDYVVKQKQKKSPTRLSPGHLTDWTFIVVYRRRRDIVLYSFVC